MSSKKQLVKVNYARPGAKGRSPYSMVAYMDRKNDPDPDPKQKPEHRPGQEKEEPGKKPEQEPEQEPEQVPSPWLCGEVSPGQPEHPDKAGREAGRVAAASYGDRRAFIAAALARTRNRVAYVHLVISPKDGSLYKARDFERLVEPSVRDRQGRESAYYAVLHADTSHPHLHVAAVRDRYTRGELEHLKGELRERMRELDRLRGGSSVGASAGGLVALGGGEREGDRATPGSFAADSARTARRKRRGA